uniref:Uncharacterized protein n=1 Tax=Plectus sambesii TaxID=2011161 RepID=A0A914UJM5_9BILA
MKIVIVLLTVCAVAYAPGPRRRPLINATVTEKETSGISGTLTPSNPRSEPRAAEPQRNQGEPVIAEISEPISPSRQSVDQSATKNIGLSNIHGNVRSTLATYRQKNSAKTGIVEETIVPSLFSELLFEKKPNGHASAQSGQKRNRKPKKFETIEDVIYLLENPSSDIPINKTKSRASDQAERELSRTLTETETIEHDSSSTARLPPRKNNEETMSSSNQQPSDRKRNGFDSASSAINALALLRENFLEAAVGTNQLIGANQQSTSAPFSKSHG